MVSRYKLTLEYDGRDFFGWQRQPEGRTVQSELEKALSSFYQRPVQVMGQGRTDKGVHAAAQVAHTDLPGEPPFSRLLPAMKGLLPSDMALLYAESVPETFHARFDALARTYRYRLYLRDSPLERHRAWIFTRPLDPDLLQICAEKILGEHDFVSFAKVDTSTAKGSVCKIEESAWSREEELLTYKIKADRFLRHMVRRLVGSMVQVSAGRLELDEFDSLLRQANSIRKGYSAPAHGLILQTVDYNHA